MIDRHLRTANRSPPQGAYPGAPDYSNFGPPAGPDGGYYGQDQYNGGGGQYDQYGNHAGYGQGYAQYEQYGHDGGAYSQGHGADAYAPPAAGYAHAQYDSPAQTPVGDVFADHTASGAQYINAQVGEDAGRSLTGASAGGVAYPNVAELGRGTSVTAFQAAQYAEIGKRLDDNDAPTAAGSDAGQAYAKLDRQPVPAARGAARPASAYDSEDAYGGI